MIIIITCRVSKKFEEKNKRANIVSNGDKLKRSPIDNTINSELSISCIIQLINNINRCLIKQ